MNGQKAQEEIALQTQSTSQMEELNSPKYI